MDKIAGDFFLENHAYIKNLAKLGHSAESIYNEIVNIYGDNIVSNRTVGKAIPW